jgi:hypothetical protein
MSTATTYGPPSIKRSIAKKIAVLELPDSITLDIKVALASQTERSPLDGGPHGNIEGGVFCAVIFT